MRRLAWMTPFALAALMACADGGDDMEGGDAATEEEADAGAAAALACAPTASGQELADRASPYDSATISVDGGQAKVCYSRPALRGRVMLGGEAVPWGQLWRFGANEPTTIHLSAAASIAGAEVEPGSYSLYAVPQEEGDWTLIVNRSTSQWGHEAQYTEEVEGQEVGRVPVRAETVDEAVEAFTIRPNPDGSGLIAEWQNSRIYIPVEPAG